MKIEYKNSIIEFNVIKSKRKSICVKVDINGDVTIMAPMRISNEKIINLVREKAEWIITKRDEMNKLNNKKIPRKFEDGSTFMYLGIEYPIYIIENESFRRIKISLDYVNNKEDSIINYSKDDQSKKGKNFIIYTNTKDEEKLRIALEKWYRAKTLEIVREKIKLYEGNFKDKASEIRVKEQKRRWASCTGKNAILFNWRCSMAREDIVEYIVVHEMCHFDYRNHSKDFWNRVAQIMPDYKEKHEYLKQNGINMYI